MKYLTFFVLLVITISSCDPYQLVYVKNYTDKELIVKVQFQKQASDFKTYEIDFSDTLIENQKSLLHYKFDNKIVPILNNDTSYTVNLPAKSTSLLSPITIGFPINKVQLSGNLGQDSILFYRLNSDIKEQFKKGRLKKVNWAFFVYNYKTIP